MIMTVQSRHRDYFAPGTIDLSADSVPKVIAFSLLSKTDQ